MYPMQRKLAAVDSLSIDKQKNMSLWASFKTAGLKNRLVKALGKKIKDNYIIWQLTAVTAWDWDSVPPLPEVFFTALQKNSDWDQDRGEVDLDLATKCWGHSHWNFQVLIIWDDSPPTIVNVLFLLYVNKTCILGRYCTCLKKNNTIITRNMIFAETREARVIGF